MVTIFIFVLFSFCLLYPQYGKIKKRLHELVLSSVSRLTIRSRAWGVALAMCKLLIPFLVMAFLPVYTLLLLSTTLDPLRWPRPLPIWPMAMAALLPPLLQLVHFVIVTFIIRNTWKNVADLAFNPRPTPISASLYTFHQIGCHHVVRTPHRVAIVVSCVCTARGVRVVAWMSD